MRGNALFSRRDLMLAGGACGAAVLLPPHVAADGAVVLEAAKAKASLLEDGGPEASVWVYGGRVPGPLLRVPQDGDLHVRLVNRLDVPTTIHWHGIRLDNAMDGVAHLTQDPVPPGGSFDYRFRVPDAGTFWYHPHVHGSGPQVDRGLHGVLVVDEREPPDVDDDIVFLFDDWRLDEDGEIDAASFGNLHDAAHAGRLGNVLTVNGKPFERIAVGTGKRLRLRVVSTANARVLRLRFGDLAPWLVALDGQPVEPRDLGGEPVVVAPGQRADLVVDVPVEPGGEIAIAEVSGEPTVAAALVATADRARDPRGTPPARLPANPVARPGRNVERTVDLVMTGGAMRFIEAAEYRGERLDGRELAMEHGMVWAMNGVAGMPEAPLFAARRGEEVAIRIVNDTLWPHAMHLHGHHFVETQRSGGPAHPGLRDTVLLEREEEATIAFVADNPGRWMLHCHMLEHQASGMETWFEVT